VLLNVPVAMKPPIESVAAIAVEIARAEGALGERGRVLVRYSGTEPLLRVMIEGEKESQIQALAESIAAAARRALGTGEPPAAARAARQDARGSDDRLATQSSDRTMAMTDKGRTSVADEAPRDATRGTVGWFVFAAGTVGVTAGQTVRVSVVNLSPSDAKISCGLWTNPRPV